MILLEPNPTPMDLRWRMFGTPVRVHPFFWLMAVLLGYRNSMTFPVLPGNGLGDLLVWILVCFVSILWHEFGHVWMGQAFGSHGHIVLHGFGGLAIGSANVPFRWQRIAVTAAGPGIQLVLWAFLYFMTQTRSAPVNIGPDGPFHPAVSLFIDDMVYVNFYWALLNLLPIYPLDGGQISRELFEAKQGSRGVINAMILSIVLAVFLAVHGFLARPGDFTRYAFPAYGDFMESLRKSGNEWFYVYFLRYLPRGTYTAILFGLLAFNSWQVLQDEKQSRGGWDDRRPWE